MPEPINDQGGSQSHGNDGRSAFSPDYVKELREEAASWRTKYREAETKAQTLEQSIHQLTVGSKVKEEISKRGLKINPDFIKLDKDGDAAKAVDKFLEDYPQFATETTQEVIKPVKKGIKPIAGEKINTNNNSAQKGNIMDIKKDPLARAKLRDQYRSMLGRGDN